MLSSSTEILSKVDERVVGLKEAKVNVYKQQIQAQLTIKKAYPAVSQGQTLEISYRILL